MNHEPSEFFLLESTSTNFHIFVVAKYVSLNVGTAVFAE